MTDKAVLFKNYLSEQADNVFIDNLLDPESIHVHKKQTELAMNEENDNDFEKFKSIVKYYTKTDNEIKDIKSKMKLLVEEKKRRHEIIQSITPYITEFMSKNQIDELNSKEGIIKYRKSMVKSPLTSKMIKEKLYETFGNTTDLKASLDNIFVQRKKVEKESLKRIVY